jgi:four helix bundle protein
MTRAQLEQRTRAFNIRCVKLCNVLPRTPAGFEIGKQLVRSSSSIGSNYRASKRAKSGKDFIYKIEVVLEESDESLYWLQLIKSSELQEGEELDQMIQEANEITSIFVASAKTAKANNKNKPQKKTDSPIKKDQDPDLRSEI